MKSVNEQPLISVIVPIYKVEQYLDRCVESIVNQTYKNLEIILVDDGSPDNCPQMCDEWAKRDNRIKVMHVPNNGAGAARNLGKDESRGEWLVFIDSDDYISTDMIESMYNQVEDDIDVVECELQMTESDEYPFDKQPSEVLRYSVEDALQLHIQDSLFRQTPVNKLYRREIVINEDFPIGKLIDDEFWTYRVLGNARNLIHIKQALYAYRQQAGSVMHKGFSLKRFHAVEAKCERLEYIINRFPALVSEAKRNLWGTCLFLGQNSLKCLSKQDQQEAFQIINDAIKKYPLNKTDISKFSLDYKIWALMSKLSMRFVCSVRNILRIGK